MPRTQRGLKPVERKRRKEPNMDEEELKQYETQLRIEALRQALIFVNTTSATGRYEVTSATDVTKIAKGFYNFLNAKGTPTNG